VLLAPYYRSYELAWERNPEENQLLRKLQRVGLIVLVVFTLLFWWLPPPKKTHMEESVPPRLARVMIESQPKPPPPPPPVVEQPKPKPVEPDKKVAMVKPPVDVKQQAREKAQKQLNQVKDELADLREQLDMSQLAQTKNLSGAVGEDSHAERNLITSKAGAGSSGITTSSVGSRGFGTGAGSLTGHDTGAISSGIARSGLDARGPTRTGSSGKAARSRPPAAARRSSWCSIARRAPSTPSTAGLCGISPSCKAKWCWNSRFPLPGK
jgi:ribosomal protein L29